MEVYDGHTLCWTEITSLRSSVFRLMIEFLWLHFTVVFLQSLVEAADPFSDLYSSIHRPRTWKPRDGRRRFFLSQRIEILTELTFVSSGVCPVHTAKELMASKSPKYWHFTINRILYNKFGIGEYLKSALHWRMFFNVSDF